MEESELIQQIKKQDQNAFSHLVDLYATMVYSVVFKMIGSKEDSEDITQEVFSTIWTTIDSFKGDSLLKTWIYRVAINKTHEFLRKKNRKKRKGFHIPIEDKSNLIPLNEQTPGEVLEYQELERAFHQSLSKIPQNQQIAFLLNRFEGMSYHEIALEMKTSHSAVESLIFRAKQNLTKLMKKHMN